MIRPMDKHVLIADEGQFDTEAVGSAVIHLVDHDEFHQAEKWLRGRVLASAASDIREGETVVFKELSGKTLDSDAKHRVLHEDEIAFVLED